MWTSPKRFRWLWLCLLMSLCLLPLGEKLAQASQTPPANSNAPKMLVRVGFDSFYKQLSWLPIQVNFNLPEGKPDFDGWLEASFSNFQDGLRYRRTVQLTAPANRTVWLYMPSENRPLYDVQVRLINRSGQELEKQSLPIKPLNQNDFLLAVISEDTSALNYLKNENLTQPFNRGSSLLFDRYNQRAINLTAPSMQVAHINPADLPPESAGWDGLDGLALTDLNSLNLSPAQGSSEQVAARWLAQGRLLMVAGDSGLRKSGFLGDLLPVKVAGSPQNKALPGELRQLSRETVPATSLLLADSTSAPGAKVTLSYDNNKPLLVERAFGMGTSIFVASDFKALPPGVGLGVWRKALADYEPRTSYPAAHRQPIEYRNIIGEVTPNTRRVTMPETWIIALVMLGYVLLLGPIGYFTLRKIGKPEWGWLSVPLMAGVLGLGLYGVGIATGGDPLVVSRLSIVTMGETASGKMSGGPVNLATIYSSSRVDFQLNASEGSSTTLLTGGRNNNYRSSSNNQNNQFSTVQQGPGGGYGQVLLGLNDQSSFLVEQDAEAGAGEGVLAQLKANGNGLEGTVENRSGKDWYDVSIWKPGSLIYNLPLLKAGEKLALNRVYAYPTSSELVASLARPQNSVSAASDESEARVNYIQQKEQVLATLLGSNGEALPSKNPARVYLVAWRQDTVNFPLKVDNRPSISVDLTLLFQPMTLK